ncbi:MAG: helix-turn-helix domain-containing protein [Nitrospirota bacterium]|nr:helix-turn-helix domain-containing protein [Nitrospirota bacterium]
MERFFRVNEAASALGYKASTMRKKILTGEVGYHRVGRIIVIPESEIKRMLGDFHKPILSEVSK